MLSVLPSLKFGSPRPKALPDGSYVALNRAELPPGIRRRIGLDIGTSSIKLVQIAWQGPVPSVESWAVVPARPGWLSADGMIALPAVVGSLLGTAVRQLGSRERRVRGALGCGAVVTRTLNLPPLRTDQMARAVEYEAALQMPAATEDLVYAFDGLAGGQAGDEEVPVFVAGVRREVFRRYLECLKLGGLHGESLELEHLVLYRALLKTGQLSEAGNSAVVLIDLGEAGTRMAAFLNGVPSWSRTVGPGLARLRGLILGAGAEVHGALTGKWLAEGIGEPSARSWLDAVAQGLQASLDFFLIQSRGAALGDIFLVGGGACLPALASWAREQIAGFRTGTGLPKPTIPHWGSIGLLAAGETTLAPVLLVALGCALKE